MAGLGRKIFTRERLTVTDTNGYLMDQTVMRFASASARTAAISAPSLGMVTFLDTTKVIEAWDGTAWQQHSAARPAWTFKVQRAGTGADTYTGVGGLLTGTWVGAPAGDYLLHVQLGLQSPGNTPGSLGVTIGAVTQATERADVPTAFAATIPRVFDYTHSGGNLSFSVVHNVGGGQSTVYNPDTRAILQFLGRRL